MTPSVSATITSATPARIDLPPGYEPSPMAITRVLASLTQKLKLEGKDPISFGGGLPNPAAIAPDRYDLNAQNYLELLAARRSLPGCRRVDPVRQVLSSYTETVSHDALRKDFAAVHGADTHIPLNPNRLVPAIGNTGAINATLMFFNNLGGPVAVFCERQAYTGFLSAARFYKNIHIMSVDMDDDGMLPGHFADRIGEARAKGFYPGFVYLVPDGGNPSGITFSQQRRDAIYQVALSEMEKTGQTPYIFEDSPYYFIRLQEGVKYPLPMAANDPAGLVMYAFSASKIGFPDPRVAWLHMPQEWAGRDGDGNHRSLAKEITACMAATGLIHSSTALAAFNGQMFEAGGRAIGLWPESEWKSAIYRRNMDLLFGALEMALTEPYPDLFQLSPKPMHGFVLTLRFPGLAQKTGMNASQLAARLIAEHEIITTPMAGFAPPDVDPTSEMYARVFDEVLRLTFSAETPARTKEGAQRLINGIKALYGLGNG